jgi:hypothetical protein
MATDRTCVLATFFAAILADLGAASGSRTKVSTCPSTGHRVRPLKWEDHRVAVMTSNLSRGR